MDRQDYGCAQTPCPCSPGSCSSRGDTWVPLYRASATPKGSPHSGTEDHGHISATCLGHPQPVGTCGGAGSRGDTSCPFGVQGAVLEPPCRPRDWVAAEASVWVGDGLFCKLSCPGGKQHHRADRPLFWEKEREFSARGVWGLGAFPGLRHDVGEHGQQRQPQRLAQQFLGSASFGMLLVVWTLCLGYGRMWGCLLLPGEDEEEGKERIRKREGEPQETLTSFQ